MGTTSCEMCSMCCQLCSKINRKEIGVYFILPVDFITYNTSLIHTFTGVNKPESVNF